MLLIKIKTIRTASKYFILTFALSIFSFSCKDKAIYEDLREFPQDIWKIEDTLKFNAPIQDTVSFYNIFISFNAKDDFLTNNLWLFISSESPDGNVLQDTVMFYITDDKGKWFGKKQGKIVKNKFVYKRHIRFPKTGIYKFFLRHGMRENDLPRASSAGIRIEKSE